LQRNEGRCVRLDMLRNAVKHARQRSGKRQRT
jgi:hypothetical protein